MLYEQPCHWTTNLRAQQCFTIGVIHAELRTWPQGNIHLAIVLVHQSLQGYRPGILVFDIEKQKILQQRNICLRTASEFQVLQINNIRVLGEGYYFALDVVGLRFVPRRVDVVRDHKAGGDVDGLVVSTL